MTLPPYDGSVRGLMLAFRAAAVYGSLLCGALYLILMLVAWVLA